MAKKRLKILLSNHHKALRTGSGYQLYLLAKELIARGHEVYALFKGERGTELHPSLAKLADLGVKIDMVKFTKLKYKHTIPELWWLHNFLKEQRFDVVNPSGGTDIGQMLISSTGVFVPALIARRGMAMNLDIFNSIKYRLPQVKRIIVISEAIKQIMV